MVNASGANGKFTLKAFYDYDVIDPELNRTPAQAAQIEPIVDWFRVACTEATITVSIPLGLTPLVGLNVQTTSQCYKWVLFTFSVHKF